MSKAIKLPEAEVLWWDDQDVVVRCPYCKSWHRHFVTGAISAPGLIEYNQKSQRAAPCVLETRTPYILLFPLSNYEIEKPWESSDESFVGKQCKARFVSSAYDPEGVPWAKDWRNDAPFRYVGDAPKWEGVLEEVDVAELEYQDARSGSTRSKGMPSVANEPVVSENDRQWKDLWRGRLQKCEEDLRAAKKRRNTAMVALLGEASACEDSKSAIEKMNESLRDVIMVTRRCCREYRCLDFRHGIEAGIYQRNMAVVQDAVDNIAQALAKLDMANDSLGHPFGKPKEALDIDANDNEAANIERELSVLSKTTPDNKVGLLKQGGKSQYIKVQSENEKQPLTSADRMSRSMVGQAFDIAEDIGFQFTTDGIDDKNIKRDWKWRVGQYNASHIEPKAIAYSVSRHTFLVKERIEGHPLYHLWKARPPESTTQTIIYVNHERICPSCSSFIEAVNAALGTTIVARCVPCNGTTYAQGPKRSRMQARSSTADGSAIRDATFSPRAVPESLVAEAPFSTPAQGTPNEQTSGTLDTLDHLSQALSSMSMNMVPGASRWTLQMSSRRTSMSRPPIVCYNCGSSTHYSTSCALPRSSWQERPKHKDEADTKQDAWNRGMTESGATVLEDDNQTTQFSEASSPPPARTPPRRLSSAQELTGSPRRRSSASTGWPQNPRHPIVCYNCGGDHNSTGCLSPKPSREQQRLYVDDAKKRQVEWNRRMSEQDAQFDQRREREQSLPEAQETPELNRDDSFEADELLSQHVV